MPVNVCVCMYVNRRVADSDDFLSTSLQETMLSQSEDMPVPCCAWVGVWRSEVLQARVSMCKVALD